MRDNDCNTFPGRNDVALIKQALEFIETLGLVWKPTLCNLDCVAVWWFRKWSPPVGKIITCCTVDQQLFPLKTTPTKDIGEVAQLTPSCLWRTRATWDANRLKTFSHHCTAAVFCNTIPLLTLWLMWYFLFKAIFYLFAKSILASGPVNRVPGCNSCITTRSWNWRKTKPPKNHI